MSLVVVVVVLFRMYLNFVQFLLESHPHFVWREIPAWRVAPQVQKVSFRSNYFFSLEILDAKQQKRKQEIKINEKNMFKAIKIDK